MTTMDSVPSLRDVVAIKLASKLSSKSKTRAKQASRVHTWIQATIRLMAQLAGFGCLTMAGFSWNIIAGYAVAGLSFFAFSWLMTKPASSTEDDPHSPANTLRGGPTR